MMILKSNKKVIEMKIRCKDNLGSSLSEKTLKVSGTSNSVFPLEIGKTYTVYSICLWEGVLNYLTIGEENLPSWYPAEFFEVVDKMIPLEWYCDVKCEEKLEAIWGYSEIVFDEYHYDELLERDDNAVRIFLDRKKEMEEYNF